MYMYEKIKNYNDRKFKRAVGIPRVLFEIFVGILTFSLNEKHKKGGRKPKLSVENILLMYLKFYRDYNTFFSLANMFGIDEANVYRWIKWSEKVLTTGFSGMINELITMSKIDVSHEHLVDVTECGIQRPKNQEIQREYYSGKKKKHTIKIQIIMDEITKKIVGVAFDKGSVHDFKLFKNSTTDLDKLIAFLADNGYQGIQELFSKSLTPKKKSKYNPLSDEDKEFNKLISNIRIAVEHVNCQLKIFRILSERYRSRIDTFNLRAILICCFYNFCL